MASIIDINKCFDTYLLQYSTDNSVRVSWHSLDFTPTESETFLDPSFFPSIPVQRELIGPNSLTRVEGFYQINIMTKKGLGLSSIYTQYEGLQEIFNRGTALTYTNGAGEDILVELNRYYMGRLNEDSPPWVFLPVQIEFRSDIWIGTP